MTSWGMAARNCGDESVEAFGIFAVRQVVAFQGAGDAGLTDQRLIPGGG